MIFLVDVIYRDAELVCRVSCERTHKGEGHRVLIVFGAR